MDGQGQLICQPPQTSSSLRKLVALFFRRLGVVAAEVHAIDAGQETLVAVLQGTMVPVPRG